MLQVERLRVLKFVIVLSQERRRYLNRRLPRRLAPLVLPGTRDPAAIAPFVGLVPVDRLEASAEKWTCHRCCIVVQ